MTKKPNKGHELSEIDVYEGDDKFTIHFKADLPAIPTDLPIRFDTVTWDCYLVSAKLCYIRYPSAPSDRVQVYKCTYKLY